MSSEARLDGLEKKPAQLLTYPDYTQAQPSIAQINLRISAIFASASATCTARFVCLTCVALKSADARKAVGSISQNAQNICLLSPRQHAITGKPLGRVGQRHSGHSKGI